MHLADARKNIDTTVAASDARRKATPPATPATSTPPAKSAAPSGPTPAQRDATEKQKNLDACLARPITQLRVAQTNPFIADRQGFESLLAAVKRCMTQPWHDCMFTPHMAALWAVEERAEADHEELFRRLNVKDILLAGSVDVCLDQPVKGTRRDCETDVTPNRAVCVSRLNQDIDQLNCDWAMLPKVWAAENTKRDADAKAKQDEACHRRFD